MTLSEEEETILKLIAAEVQARFKLDAERQKEELEFRLAWNPLRAQIEAAHKAKMDELRAAQSAASADLKAGIE